MKLFIWNAPYQVPYGGSCLYALAETVEQAREVALSALRAEYGHTPHPEEDRCYRLVGLALAEPTRILEGPIAEVYEWSE